MYLYRFFYLYFSIVWFSSILFYCSLSSCAHDLNIPLHITMWSIIEYQDTAHSFGTTKMQQLISRLHYGIGVDSSCMEIFQHKNMNYAMLTHFVFKSYHTYDIPKAEENSKYKFGLVCAIVNFKWCFFFVLFSNSMPYWLCSASDGTIQLFFAWKCFQLFAVVLGFYVFFFFFSMHCKRSIHNENVKKGEKNTAKPHIHMLDLHMRAHTFTASGGELTAMKLWCDKYKAWWSMVPNWKFIHVNYLAGRVCV